MRRGADEILVTTLHDEQVTIGKASVELHSGIGKRAVERVNKFLSLFGSDIARTMVLDLVTVKTDEIDAHSHFVLHDGHAHACGFE